MKKWYVMLTAVLCVVCVIFLLSGKNDVLAANAQELISDTLQRLEVSDAVLAPIDNAEDCVVYTSAKDGMSYYFNAGSGVLEKIVNDDVEQMELGEDDMALEPDALRSVALDAAANSIAPQMIGELYVKLETVSGDTTTYEIIEKYDGIPTGTKIGLIYRNDGELFACVPHYGSVFVKKADGRVTLVKGDDFIGEDEAASHAIDALRSELDYEIGDATVISVEMTALGGELSYAVMIENADQSDPLRVYDIRIDAYTGAVLEILFTM